MATTDMEFFPQRPDSYPKVYAYEHIGVESQEGFIKVGYTVRDVEDRVYEIEHTSGVPYRILAYWNAMKNDGTVFTDHDVHAVLKRKGHRQLNEGEDRNEWFECTLNDVKAAVTAVQTGTENVENRTQTFAMRPEQELAVDKTIKYFESAYEENISNFDDEDEVDELPTTVVEAPRLNEGAKRTPIVPDRKPSSGSTYHPSYVPPTPSVPMSGLRDQRSSFRLRNGRGKAGRNHRFGPQKSI